MASSNVGIALDHSKISCAMANNGLGLKELAERMEMSKAGVYSLLKKDSVRPKAAGKIANALNCKVEDLI